MTEITGQDSSLWLAALTGGILLLSVAAAWLTFLAMGKLARSRQAASAPSLASVLLYSLRTSLFIGIFLTGAYLATLVSPFAVSIYPYIAGALPVLLALLAVYLTVALLGSLLHWYGMKTASNAGTKVNYFVIPFLRLAVPAGGLLVALLLVLEALGIRAGPISAWLLEHGGRTVLIAVLGFTMLLLAEQAIPRMVNTALARRVEDLEEEAKKRAETLSRTMVVAAQILAIVVASFMIIAEVGINIGPLLAGLGVAGIAIGFGTQSLVKDLVGGFFIIVENQYRIGDVVKIGEVAGLVEDVSLRRTVLRDLDGVVHSVPNGEVRIASNFTRELSRINLNVAVASKEDPERVIALINDAGAALARDPDWSSLVVTPPQGVGVDYFGDASFEIKILGDTRPIRQWDVMRELRLRIKKLFDEEGIELKPSQQGLLRQLAVTARPRPAPATGQRQGVHRSRRQERSDDVLPPPGGETL